MDQTENPIGSFAFNSDAENLHENFNSSHEYMDLFQEWFSSADDVKTSEIEPSNGEFASSTSEIMAAPVSSDPENEVDVPWDIHKRITSKIETLKKMNCELQQINQEQEKALAEYEDQLSEKMHKLMDLQSEKNSLDDKFQILRKEREDLSIKLDQKMAELKQFKGLAREGDEAKILDLQKSLNQETKQLKKMERELQRSNTSLNIEHDKNKKIERFCKKLMKNLLEFGEKLKNSALLSPKDMCLLESVKESCREGTINWELNLGELNVCVKEHNSCASEEQHSADNSINSDAPTSNREFVSIKVGNMSSCEVQDTVVEPSKSVFLPLDILNASKVITSTPRSSHHALEGADFTTHSDSVPLVSHNEDIDSTSVHNYPILENHCEMLSDIEEIQNHNNCDSNMLPTQNFQENHNGNKLPTDHEEIQGKMPCFAKPKEILPNLGQNCEAFSDKDSDNFTDEDFDKVRRQVYFNLENFKPLSPIASSPHQKSPVPSNNIETQESPNFDHPVAKGSHSSNINQNNMVTPKKVSPKYLEKRNALCHQTSRGFEPHIEETSIKSESDTILNNQTLIKQEDNSALDESKTVPSNLHYISSFHVDNTTFIYSEGSAICDVLINTATGQSISSVTQATPKELSFSNLASKSNTDTSMLSTIFNNLSEKKRNAMSCYHAACEASVLSKTEQKSPLSSPKPKNDQKFPFFPSTTQAWTKNGKRDRHRHSSRAFNPQFHSLVNEVHPSVPAHLNAKNVQNTVRTPEKVHTLSVKNKKDCLNSVHMQIHNNQQTLTNNVSIKHMMTPQSPTNSTNESFHHSDVPESSFYLSNKMHTERQCQNNSNSTVFLPSTPRLQVKKENANFVPLNNFSGRCKEPEKKEEQLENCILAADLGCSNSVSTNEQLSVSENAHNSFKQNHSIASEKYSSFRQVGSDVKLQILSPPTSPGGLFGNGPLSPIKDINDLANQSDGNKTENINAKRNGIKRQSKIQINEADNVAAVVPHVKMQDCKNFKNMEQLGICGIATTDKRLNSMNKISQPVNKKCKRTNDSVASKGGIKEYENFEDLNESSSNVLSANRNIDLEEVSSKSKIKNVASGLNYNLFSQTKVEESEKPSLNEIMTCTSKESSCLLSSKSLVKMHESGSSKSIDNTCFSNSATARRNTNSSKIIHKQQQKLDLNALPLQIKNKVKSLNLPQGNNFDIKKSLDDSVKHPSNLSSKCSGLIGKISITNNPDANNVQIAQETNANIKGDDNTMKITSENLTSFSEINTLAFEENKILASSVIKLGSENSEVTDISRSIASSKVMCKPQNKQKISLNASNVQINSEVKDTASPFIPSSSKNLLSPLKRSPRIAERKKPITNVTFPAVSNSVLPLKIVDGCKTGQSIANTAALVNVLNINKICSPEYAQVVPNKGIAKNLNNENKRKKEKAKKSVQKANKKSKRKSKKKRKAQNKRQNFVSSFTEIAQMKHSGVIDGGAGVVKGLQEPNISTNVSKACKTNITYIKQQLQNSVLKNSVCSTVKKFSDSGKTEREVVDSTQNTVDNHLTTLDIIPTFEPLDSIDFELKSSKNRSGNIESSKKNLFTCGNIVYGKEPEVNNNSASSIKSEQFSNENSSASETPVVKYSDLMNGNSPLHPLASVSPGLFSSQSKDFYNGMVTETDLRESTEETQIDHSPSTATVSQNIISENSASSAVTVKAEIHTVVSSNISKLADCVPNSFPSKNGYSINESNDTSPAKAEHTRGNDLNGQLSSSNKSDLSDDESALIIVENNEENCVFENDSSPDSDKLVKTSVNPSKRKTETNKRKVSGPSEKKQRLCNGNAGSVPSIAKAFEELERLKFYESHSKLRIHTLINAFINPANAPDAKYIVLELVKHLSASKRNPFLTFTVGGLPSSLFPAPEQCIVDSLDKVQEKKKGHLQGLITSTINTLHYLVLSKTSVDIYGLSAFCRILTAVCKCSENINRPVMLCADLLKMQHKYAPFLIASVVGVWPDLFDVAEDISELEMQFHRTIAYGVKKKPKTLNATQWKLCCAVLSRFLLAQPTSDVIETTTTIIDHLKFVLNEEPVENEFLLIDPLVIFCGYEGWEWTQRNVLDTFIVPSLEMYADNKNERAFGVVSDLYADTVLLSPNPQRYLQHMERYFFRTNASSAIKFSAALSLLKIFLKIQISIPDYLQDWMSDNNKMLLHTPAFTMLSMRLIADSLDLTLQDVISENIVQ